MGNGGFAEGFSGGIAALSGNLQQHSAGGLQHLAGICSSVQQD
jgi:hypothetical protein